MEPLFVAFRKSRSRNHQNKWCWRCVSAASKNTTGRVRYFHIPDGTRASIQPIIDEHLGHGTQRVYTDSSAVYDFSINVTHKHKHRTVNHSQQWVVPGSRIHTNTVESSFSLLKRGLIGSFHRVSIKHLHRYLTEFEYRFNARRDAERFEKTVAEMLQDQADADEGTHFIES